MQQVYPDEGLEQLLDWMLANTIKLHLYVNDLTPTKDTVLADLTEAAWTGYAVEDILTTDWSVKGVSAHNGYALSDPKAFDNGSGADQDAYGYYYTDSAETMLLAIVRFDSAPITKADGETWTVFPTWGDFSQYP